MFILLFVSSHIYIRLCNIVIVNVLKCSNFKSMKFKYWSMSINKKMPHLELPYCYIIHTYSHNL